MPQNTTGSTGARNALSVISTSGSNSTVDGTIEGGTASKFNVDAGSGCGMVNVTTTGSTSWAYNGHTVSAGTPVTFTATGSCGTSFAASSVTLGSGDSANVSGTIVAVSGTTINVNGGSACGMVNVTFNTGTGVNYNGYKLSAGVPIQVWGTGSCSTSFVAKTITLGSGGSGDSTSSQKHVLTADYLGGADGSNKVSASTAATVLSWVESSPENGTAYSAAGMKTMDYIDPFRQARTDPLFSSDSTTFSKTCGSSDISIAYSGTTLYLMNPGSYDLESKMNAWQASQKSVGHVDAFFYDDIDTLYGTTSPCNMSQTTWDSENSSFIASSKYPVVFNGYAMHTDSASLIKVSATAGGVVEGCYATWSAPSPPYTTGSAWVLDENLQLEAAAANKLYFCYNTGSQVGSSYTALRSYIYASFLLSYSPASSVLWETFTTSSDVHVFPETKIVPTEPLVSAPSAISSLESSTGVYVREYAACYLAGTNVGRCAAVVNSNASSSESMPTLKQSYSHTMAVSGAGTLDGGSVSVTGAKAPATIPAKTGYVLFE